MRMERRKERKIAGGVAGLLNNLTIETGRIEEEVEERLESALGI